MRKSKLKCVPSEEIIIADSSPLIGLARIGQLGLRPKLARRIGVPRAVWAEVTSARTDAPGASRWRRKHGNGIYIRQELMAAALQEVGE